MIFPHRIPATETKSLFPVVQPASLSSLSILFSTHLSFGNIYLIHSPEGAEPSKLLLQMEMSRHHHKKCIEQATNFFPLISIFTLQNSQSMAK